MEHPQTRGTSRCAPGAFSLTAPVFRSPRAQKGAWCARDSTWAAGPGAHGESTILRQARSQPHHQHQKPRANQTSSPGNTTHQPAATTSPAPEATRQSNQQPRQHHTPTRINHITSTRSHAPIKPAAPATPHINPQQPHHQRQNRASTTPPVMAEPHLQQQKPRANRITTIGNTTRQPPHQRRLHQRFLYCDGETPNISLKYFAKYFCVPKPTASETSTTLSPASADNSWAALLSRMVRMNTEGFIP